MRLLHVSNLEFREFLDGSAPPYVVASHRWLSDGAETTYKDVLKGRNRDKAGHKKVEAFCAAVLWYNQEFQCVPPLEWLWIDTCCIDERSSAEVSRSINSMCKWYRRAELCLAYLADVSPTVRQDDAGQPERLVNSFLDSEWFKRGWTLQELLAPKIVLFFDRHWNMSGRKDNHPFQPNCADCLRVLPCAKCARLMPHAHYNVPSWNNFISHITGVPTAVLVDFDRRHEYSIQSRMAWAANRKTTEPEDIAYCMLGIFDVYLPLIYGEGASRALKRLHGEIPLAQPSPRFLGSGLEERNIRDGLTVNTKTDHTGRIDWRQEEVLKYNTGQQQLGNRLYEELGQEHDYQVRSDLDNWKFLVSNRQTIPAEKLQIEEELRSDDCEEEDNRQGKTPIDNQSRTNFNRFISSRDPPDSQRLFKHLCSECPPRFDRPMASSNHVEELIGASYPLWDSHESFSIVRRVSASNRELWNSGGPWGKGPPPSGDPANPYGYQREPSDPESPREGERGFLGVTLSKDCQHWLTSRDILGHTMYKTTSPTGTRFAWDRLAKQRYIVRVESEDESNKSGEESNSRHTHLS